MLCPLLLRPTRVQCDQEQHSALVNLLPYSMPMVGGMRSGCNVLLLLQWHLPPLALLGAMLQLRYSHV